MKIYLTERKTDVDERKQGAERRKKEIWKRKKLRKEKEISIN